ncbi:MAG: DNA repair protein RecN [Acidobacteriota bacterium]
MITYLKVRNLAIVEEFTIEPGPGLNVLTGETGAGKSLLIDSLDFLSGARGSSESIRSGTEKMSAEAILTVPLSSTEALVALGIEMETVNGSAELLIKRELSANGRGRAQLNGSLITVRELNTIMDRLVDIHGQNEARDRIAGKSGRELLDEYAEAAPRLEATRAAHAEWRGAAGELETITSSERDRALRLDLLKYQIDEISVARLAAGEEETLREERIVLANAGEMIASTGGAFSLLEADEDSAIALLARAEHLLEGLAAKIASIGAAHSELREARFHLQEIARSVSAITDSVRHDPDRLEEIEDRLVAIERLKKKYGGTVEAVIDHLEASREEFDRLSDYEASVAQLDKQEKAAFQRFAAAATHLSELRQSAATILEHAVEDELRDLAMEGTSVRVSVSTTPAETSPMVKNGQGVAFGADGFDKVELLIAPNRGEEPKPMQRIASGGELSRIQLAIAAALFERSQKSAEATLVFDEIDAGIGGRVAEAVGRKLLDLARSNQVICVTHLPQIAGMAGTHFRVWKEVMGDHTVARIARLDSDQERVEEIARMLAGQSVTDSARAHAAELLRSSDLPAAGRKPRRSAPVLKQ